MAESGRLAVSVSPCACTIDEDTRRRGGVRENESTESPGFRLVGRALWEVASVRVRRQAVDRA